MSRFVLDEDGSTVIDDDGNIVIADDIDVEIPPVDETPPPTDPEDIVPNVSGGLSSVWMSGFLVRRRLGTGVRGSSIARPSAPGFLRKNR